MTTGATLLGMLPVAIGVGAGSEMRAPMAIAIMGGLFASSILSLIVIPVVYSLMAETNLNYFKASSTKETWN
jgi:multidrug efflux pump subunit AcrB